jgi:hypothetical protein
MAQHLTPDVNNVDAVKADDGDVAAPKNVLDPAINVSNPPKADTEDVHIPISSSDTVLSTKSNNDVVFAWSKKSKFGSFQDELVCKYPQNTGDICEDDVHSIGTEGKEHELKFGASFFEEEDSGASEDDSHLL